MLVSKGAKAAYTCCPVYSGTKGVSSLQLILIDLINLNCMCPDLVNLNLDCNNYSHDSSGDVT